MLSIITAVHNQLPVNRLFWEHLARYTTHPFELIVIDNASTDGSAEFFESVGAIVIRNPVNYSYPHAQNQGIAVARHDWLGFLNNDIIVSPGWDAGLMATMEKNGLEICTVCGVEQVENAAATKQLKRRWKRIKNLLGLFGFGEWQLRLMHRWMYGNWEAFCADRRQRFAGQVKEGFVGNTVMMRRSLIDKIGPWDPRVQAGDFDMYLRTVERARTVGDVKPMHLALDVFVHHYIRLTVRTKYPPYADAANLIRIEDKWTAEQRAALDRLNQ